MAVVEMRRLNLVAMSYDRDKILNALQKTQATEIKLHKQTENTVPIEEDGEALRVRLARAENALEVLSSRLANYYKGQKPKLPFLKKKGEESAEQNDVLKEPEVSYSEFMSAKDTADECEELISGINQLLDTERELKAELARVNRIKASLQIYSGIDSSLKLNPTAHTKARLGLIPTPMRETFIQGAEDIPLAAYRVLAQEADSTLVLLAAHKAAEDDAQSLLQSVSFSACPFDDGRSGEELYNDYSAQAADLEQRIAENGNKIIGFESRVRSLKIYCDYLGFELEKIETAEKLRATRATFLLEAYVPVSSEDKVREELSGLNLTTWFEFSVPEKDETPPTLLKNKKFIGNFESITNTYSPVNYREFDPNTVMAFFYSVFLGFIMGDIGYGLLMFGVGLFMTLRGKRPSGLKQLAGVFAVGGIFTIFWGFLYNSLFGIQILPYTVIPDAMEGRYTIMGIQIPSVLIIAMLVGTVQLCAGYVCKAVQCFRRKQILDGIFGGLTWAFFMVGVEVAVVGLVEEFHIPTISVLGFTLPILAVIGGGIAVVSLLIAMVTAGRGGKFFGYFTKGFAAAYGVINIVSDMLSYARLYGLMLSGAVIAQIISGFVITGYNGSTPFFASGNVLLIALGVILMVVGHVFNLAIGLLGAYIHDSRLQYVEFYGRFFEGEGTIFTPLGSQHKHIYLS